MVEGIVRPKQDWLGDAKRERVIPILLHGDAAFAGQGVVAETLNLSQLEELDTAAFTYLSVGENRDFGIASCPSFVREWIDRERGQAAA